MVGAIKEADMMAAAIDRPDGQYKRVLTTAMVIDDHPLFCDALSMTLQTASDILPPRSPSLMAAQSPTLCSLISTCRM
jgi:hypothetical protein